MSQTERFDGLRTRLTELQEHLITKEVSETGEYSEEVKDRARGYRLLAHAEIESYLEDSAQSISTKALAKWQTSRIGSMELISVLASFKNDTEVGDKQLAALKTTEQTVNYSFVAFHKKIAKNNGVKEKDIKALMTPLGLDVEVISPELIPLLESFGSKRGEVAHTTALKREINPIDEINDVNNIFKHLEQLDHKVLDILNSLS